MLKIHQWARALSIISAAFALFVGLVLGLIRTGWSLSLFELTGFHSLVMTSCFLGTLILIERVAALNRPILYIIPSANIFSLFFVFQSNLEAVLLVVLFCSLALTGINIYLMKTHRNGHYWMMAIGSACWAGGTAMTWVASNFLVAIPFWMVFLLLTIVSERVDMTQFLPIAIAHKAIVYLLSFFAVVALFLPFHHSVGSTLLSLSIGGIALWLLRFDPVVLNLKKTGLKKYVAVGLVVGYVWLLLAAVFMGWGAELPGALDIGVHTFFIGFVMMMVFAHGPIVFPSIIGRQSKPFHKMLYLPYILINVSLLWRVLSNVLVWGYSKQWASMFNSLSILVFAILMLFLFLRKAPHQTLE